MRQLIINADDLGAYNERSRAIFDAWEGGVVSSATLICNGHDAEDAAAYVKKHNLPTGLHLSLSEGSPICAPADIVSLLGSDGQFRSRADQYRALTSGQVELADLEREISAQLDWFLQRYGQPTHVDGHQHMHVHPVVVPILISVLKTYGIQRVRLPYEDRPPNSHVVTDERLAYIRPVSSDAAAARPLFAACGIRSTDHFRGMYHMGQSSAESMRKLLESLPDGTTELMVHPGYPIAVGGWFDTDPERQIEFDTLTDPDLRAFLAERTIRLHSYRDLV